MFVFALLALICFVLALFNVRLGELDVVVLGWIFISAHLLLGAVGTMLPVRRRE